jgi:hypothetical protein
MAIQLPPGWVITESIEVLPGLNAGTPMQGGYFARRTFTCTNAAGAYVCSSGALEDCESQAQTAAQSRTQQQPYYQ